MASNLTFYSNLKVQHTPIHKLIRNSSAFLKVPENWVVVVTDVLDSTKAVNSGNHQKVNLAATGSVVTVMNTLKAELKAFEIPYFFGGDGAIFLIPAERESQVKEALVSFSHHVEKNLQLTLRTGFVLVSDIYKSGYEIKIAKVRINKYLIIPLILGNGLQHAEYLIKHNYNPTKSNEVTSSIIDLEGMECRWDKISPKKDKNKVVCLIVSCEDESLHSQIYADILDMIDLTFGTFNQRQPISTTKLKLNATLAKIREEMVARIGKNKMSYLLKHFLITYFGKFYFKFFAEGRAYLNKVSQLSDTIMIDGSLNTVMEGGASQIEMLTNYLDLLEKEGKIKYGLHATYASVMSCYVQDRGDNHIHFVDGTEGGYTSAAIIYKKKYSDSPAVA
ncbi:hypothetical protein BST97_14615 [Nonlabens spongiae]|uniref:DUF3095 domain-containing protein n=1 Tax=Nonlabens spongiae TaxID=331648 RepID=A0A1W6MNE6_9FLAO|nr:DUF3095 family protein [Nonlabens spongiae]ARN79118.1 hypothetical protein BST97_14615 [Nonlabens spongiae]